MRPINKKHFGPEAGKIAIKFHNGTSVVTGYIIKQLGTHKYLVSDGTVTKTVTLVSNATDAGSLTGNKATIEVATPAGVDYISKLLKNTAATVTGATVKWGDDVAPGKGQIKKISSAPILPTPTAISDFKNGVYTIAGVPSTFSAQWEHQSVWQVFDPATLVNGVGLSLKGVGTTSGGPATTVAMASAIGITSDFTMVVDLYIHPDGVGSKPNVTFETFEPTSSGYNDFIVDSEKSVQSGSYDPYDFVSHTAGIPSRVAVNYGLTSGSWSLDGGSTITRTINSGTNIPYTSLGIFLNLVGPDGPASEVTIKKITFYPLQPANSLPALSAL